MEQSLILKQLSEAVAGGFNACDRMENGQLYMLVNGVPTLNKDWTIATVDILVSVPNTYPVGGLDAFYVDSALMLHNGQKHSRVQPAPNILGKSWGVVSWHYNKPWSFSDTFLTHIYHCQDFLRKGSRSN
ncbi:MAG: hypothetical protein HQL12_02965 [Candidatus Omnitrophica bacterium]|nr:hypothetical protein [Candidatus Omnitrophota bacterium]